MRVSNQPSPACRYGGLIFIVEMMGATATLRWGVNIILNPVNEPLRQDPDNPGLTIVSSCSLIGGAVNCPMLL